MQPFSCNGDYAYRKHDDGSTDLVCLYCYRTLVRSADDNTLARTEATHCCSAKSSYRETA